MSQPCSRLFGHKVQMSQTTISIAPAAFNAAERCAAPLKTCAFCTQQVPIDEGSSLGPVEWCEACDEHANAVVDELERYIEVLYLINRQ